MRALRAVARPMSSELVCGGAEAQAGAGENPRILQPQELEGNYMSLGLYCNILDCSSHRTSRDHRIQDTRLMHRMQDTRFK